MVLTVPACPFSSCPSCCLRGCRQAVRVAALKRVFERKEGSPHRFRYEIFKYIAQHEPKAWALCGTKEQQNKATEPFAKGQRVHPGILTPWISALVAAFGSFEFDHVVGNREGMPNGYSTNELVFLK